MSRSLSVSRLEPALADYVGAHQQSVYTFCYWALGDAGRARTMTQDVFARMWPVASPVAHDAEALRVLRIAYRRCRRALRQNPAAVERHEPEGSGVLSQAPADCRCLLILHFYCGLTPEDVAFVTGLSLADVKQRLLRARRAMRP